MALSDLQVFQEYAYLSKQQVLGQQIELFNAATNGALILRGGNMRGDFQQDAFFQQIANLINRRDPYATGAVTPTKLVHTLQNRVRIGTRAGPVDLSQSQFRWIGEDPRRAGAILGQQLAERELQDMLNTTISALVGALTTSGDTLHDATAGTLTHAAMNAGQAKFGDAYGSIRCWVMHSKVWFDVYGANLANASNLFTYGNVNVLRDPMGRPFVISDIPALFNATPTPDEYRTLGLVAGAAIIEQNNDFDDAYETRTGDENLIRYYQAEWSWSLGIKAFSWDTTNGGKAPTNAELATGTNWDEVTGSSVKEFPGVIIESQ